jgi:hypothetical protein
MLKLDKSLLQPECIEKTRLRQVFKEQGRHR